MRDISLFPEDAIGNALWQFKEQGVVLEQENEVEFSVIFPTQEQALKFGHLLLENGQKLSFSPFDANPDFPWEITAYPFMPLNYENIIAYQALLEEHCPAFGGKYDGWYCQPVV